MLRFTGGHADETKQSAITSIYTKINGKQTVKCVGKNPRLAAAKSKNDKNISGLISSIGETKLSIYTFTNALALDGGEEKLSIINMEFASSDETNAEFHVQAIMDVESNPDTRTLTAETTIDLGTTTDDAGNEVENKKVISFPLSSEVGFKDICRKVLIFLLVGIANVLDVQVIGTSSALRTAVIFFYISNEDVSLLENAAHLGLPVPDKIKIVLEQLHDREENEDT